MVKFVYCITKRSDLSNEEFASFWRDVHGPFIRGLAQTLRATKYIQSYTLQLPINTQIAQGRGLATPPYDGITEIWWASMEDFQAGIATPEGMEATRTYITDQKVGEVNFVDFARSRAFLTEEHVVFDFSPAPAEP